MGLPIKWLMIFCWLVSFEVLAKTSDVHFSKKKIVIKNIVLAVEIAETPVQHQQGLMFRERLLPGSGMLFVFPNEEYRSFWMKNTYIDLSIGYFDKHRRLIEVLDMKGSTIMQKHFPSYPSSKPAQYALEVPMGWFKQQGIKNGEVFNYR